MKKTLVLLILCFTFCAYANDPCIPVVTIVSNSQVFADLKGTMDWEWKLLTLWKYVITFKGEGSAYYISYYSNNTKCTNKITNISASWYKTSSSSSILQQIINNIMNGSTYLFGSQNKCDTVLCDTDHYAYIVGAHKFHSNFATVPLSISANYSPTIYSQLPKSYSDKNY